MNKDLEVFENRSDDWLAKERAYENSVSAWDLDEGKKIKEYHEDHCEAEYIKETHAKAHQNYDEKIRNYSVKNDQYQNLDGKAFIKIFSPFIVVVFLIMLVGMLGETMGGISFDSFGFLFPIIIFIVLSLTLTKNKRRK